MYQVWSKDMNKIKKSKIYRKISKYIYLSVKNKLISGDDDHIFLGEENEWLATYAKRKLETSHYDYFIFGHRHLPMEIQVGEGSTYFNLGDWIHHYTYGVYDGDGFVLETFEGA